MSATPPPPPAVIGSGKPHTVSLKPGSNVATRKTARKPDDDKGNDLTARLMATLRRSEEAGQARKGPPAGETPAPPPASTATADSATASSATGLSSAIQKRIAELRQRNEAVGRELDRLPAAGKRAR